MKKQKKFDEARAVFNKIAKINGKPSDTADNFSFLKTDSEREKDIDGQELETVMDFQTQDSAGEEASIPRKKESTVK